jgi:ATP synthase protein I
MHQTDARQVKRVLVMHTGMTLVLTSLAFVFGSLIALSVLIGAAVCTLANGVFAFGVFGRYRAAQPGQLVMRFYAAEVLKIVVILALFGAAIALIEGLNLPALLGSYFLVQVLPVLLASQRDAADTNVRK